MKFNIFFTVAGFNSVIEEPNIENPVEATSLHDCVKKLADAWPPLAEGISITGFRIAQI